MPRIVLIAVATAALLLVPGAALADPSDDPPPPDPLFAPEEPNPPPSIAGTAQEGQVLTGDQGGWTDATLTNDWRRCNEATCESTGQTGATYTLTSADVGSRIKLRVRGESPLMGVRYADSELTGVVAALPPPPPPPPPEAPSNLTAPEISGIPREGKTLSASQGSWSGTAPITYSYSWLRCSDDCTPTGATGTTYALTADDAGSRMAVEVTATNAAGSATAGDTSATVAGRPRPQPAPQLARLSPFPVVIISGRLSRTGADIGTLAVRRAPRGARVTVRCKGPGCPFARRTRRVGRSSRMRVRAMEVDLPAGTVITVLIRKGRALGKFTRIRIRRRTAPARVDRCLRPGSSRPVACPAA